MVEPNNQSRGTRPSFSPLKWLGIFVVLVLVLTGVWAVFHFSGSRAKTTETVSPKQTNATAAMPPVLITNQAALVAFDSRWAGVVGVLNAMKEWGDANPICHMLVTTEGMGGKTYADTEMFRFFDGTNLLTRAKVHLRFPNDVTFIIEQEGEDMIVFLPQTDQLVKVDAKKEIKDQLGWDLQRPNAVTFLNLLRVAFVETNGPQRALTFAFKPEAMNTPAAASIDVFTTLRIDDKGALQTIEVTEAGEHRVMRLKYLSFQQEEVSRGAPQIPADKPVVTGKAFNLALQEEIIKMREKGTRI